MKIKALKLLTLAFLLIACVLPVLFLSGKTASEPDLSMAGRPTATHVSTATKAGSTIACSFVRYAANVPRTSSTSPPRRP